jgi:hypothetical protein
VSSPADFASWNEALGGGLTLRMFFQAWCHDGDPAALLEGPATPVVSWEPWRPTPPGTPADLQGAPQPRYSNAAIAAGEHDAYLRRWAQAIRCSRRPVILRPMHEFNGFWYPWSHDPDGFVRAWRHMRELFAAAGADNVTWVWSFQVNANVDPQTWTDQVDPYWPGSDHVDVLGMSMVRYANTAASVGFYLGHLDLAHRRWGLPTMITEANVDHAMRLQWLAEVRSALAAMPHNLGLIWSQAPSLEAARNPAAGAMDWDAREDPRAASLLSSIAALPA